MTRWLWVIPFVLGALVVWLVQRKARLTLSPGDRVRVAGSWRRQTGSLVEPTTSFGRRAWILELDGRSGRRARLAEYRLRPFSAPSGEWLREGGHAQITGGLLMGRTGILIRPARLLWYHAWLLQLDEPIPGPLGRRTRIADHLLVPVKPAGASPSSLLPHERDDHPHPRRRRHHVNRRRTWGLALMFMPMVLLSGWVASTISVESSDDLFGRTAGIALAAIGALASGRVMLLGLWVSEQQVTVRSWLRTKRVGLDSVARFDTHEQRGRQFPAVVLESGEVIPIPMLEKGVLSEMRSPEEQWGPLLTELNTLVSPGPGTRRRREQRHFL